MLEFILIHVSLQALLWFIVLLPLIGFLVNGMISLLVSQYRLVEPKWFVALISIVIPILTLTSVSLLWYILYSLEGAAPSMITGSLMKWSHLLIVPIEFALKADQLSLSIGFIIAFIGLLVHIYSVGFFAKRLPLSLVFAFLNLVLALEFTLIFTSSILFFYTAWILLALLGVVFFTKFFEDGEKSRSVLYYCFVEFIASSALLFAIFLIYKASKGDLQSDIFQFANIQINAAALLPYSTMICISLLVSTVLRSLQIPFYIWLPEMSKTPLPVFLSIYAVSFGLIAVYLLVRLNFILVLSFDVLKFAAILGALAAVLAALFAIFQNDIRKLLSYFVMSQFGLAFVGVGIGAFASSVFYLFTNAVYVAAIFMSVGSVIVITGSTKVEQFKGLRRYLPVTFLTCFVGVISAIGIYPMAGFFGRNGILWEAYQRGYSLVFISVFIATILISIALFRMIALQFFSRRIQKPEEVKRYEESSVSMLVCMVIVAFLSIVIGWFGVSSAFGGGDYFRKWLEPGFATQMVHVIGDRGNFSELVLAVIATIFAAHAGLVTWIIFVYKRIWVLDLAAKSEKTIGFFVNAFYINQFYKKVIFKPLALFCDRILCRGVDRVLIDGLIVESVGRVLTFKEGIVNKFRVTMFQTMILWLMLGLILLIVWSLF